MKKAIGFLTGLGLSLILIAGGLENSLAEMKANFTASDTFPANAGKIVDQQAENSQKMVAKKKFSFKPKPLPKCSSFLITEFGWSFGLGKSSDKGNLRLLNWELGYMVNRDEHSALGGTFVIAVEPDGGASRLGLKARYRRWLRDGISLDIAPGIFILGGKNKFSFPSFTCHVGLNLSDWFALTGQVEIIRWKKSGYDFTWQNGLEKSARWEKTETDFRWYAGFKLGTPLGAGVGTAVAALIAIVGFGTVSSSNLGGWSY